LAALALATGLVHAQEMPARRPGLWEITMQSADAPSHTVRQCVDAATDRRMQESARSAQGSACTSDSWRRDGERFVGESVCRVGGSVATSRSVFAGDFAAAYRGEVETRFEPPVDGVARSTVKITGRWTGPCPPGWAPGDMEIPGVGRLGVDALTRGRGPSPAK